MAYSQEEIKESKEKIINLLAEGKSLKNIIDSDKTIPTRAIVYQWLNKTHKDYDSEFLNNYVRAREESADLDAETIQEIAEKTLKGTYEPSAARVAMEGYKWNASKKQPKKYGDKLDLTIDDIPRTPEEREKRILELKQKLENL